MGLRINQNIDAFNAFRNLSVTQGDMSKSLEKLSSGFRINRAADDAAGLAISEGLRSQIGGYKVAIRNAQDGISVVQTTEGALNEVHSILQRMRDLAVQAANDSNSSEARANLATERDQLTAELDRIADATNFNGTKLLDGSGGVVDFQVGADNDSSSRISVDLQTLGGYTAATTGTPAVPSVPSTPASSAGLRFTNFNLQNMEASDFLFFRDDTNSELVAVLGSVLTAAGALNGSGNMTSVQNVANALNGDSTFSSFLVASVSGNDLIVRSNDPTHTTLSNFGYQRADNGAPGLVAPSNMTGNLAADPGSPGSPGIPAGPGTPASYVGFTAAGLGVTGLDFSSHSSSQSAIDAIDDAIGSVSTARAKLGAYQNRFEHTIANVNVAIENLSASESRIRDTDMAQEMMSLTRSQILAQAGTAMLAQANSAPQSVLQLLG